MWSAKRNYLFTFEANVVRVPVHGILSQVSVICTLHDSFILQPSDKKNENLKKIAVERYSLDLPHHCLPSDVIL